MNHLEQESSCEDDAQQDQQALLESTLDLAFSAYDMAKSEGVVDPVVFLLDCEDTIGGQIARSWLGEETVDHAIRDQQEQLLPSDIEETTTVFAHAFSWAQCTEEVPKIFSYLAPIFYDSFQELLPKDGFLAISVTSGGASALTVPFSARDSE